MCESQERQFCMECGEAPSDNRLWLNGICACCLRINHELVEVLQFHSLSEHKYLRNIFGQD